VLAAAATTLALAACGEDEGPAVEPAATAGGAPASADAALPPATTVQGFLARAALSDLYEVQAAQAVLARTQNADVRRFAQMMVQDHTRTTNEAQAAVRAQSIDLTPPPQLDARRQEMVRALRSATAADLDARYVEQQVEAHENTLNLMRDFAQNGDNAALKDWARRTAPVIENHLQMARAMNNPAAGGTRPPN
jgi:putative membrane protein